MILLAEKLGLKELFSIGIVIACGIAFIGFTIKFIRDIRKEFNDKNKRKI